MAKQPKYEICEEQTAEIKAARRKNAAATGFHFAYVSTLVSKYVHNG